MSNLNSQLLIFQWSHDIWINLAMTIGQIMSYINHLPTKYISAKLVLKIEQLGIPSFSFFSLEHPNSQTGFEIGFGNLSNWGSA